MTVICVCNGIMAADGAVFYGDDILTLEQKKIVINPAGSIAGKKVKCIGCSGAQSDINLFLGSMINNEIDLQCKFNKLNFYAIAVLDDGSIIEIESSPDDDKALGFVPVSSDYLATGAGKIKAMSYLQSEKEIIGAHDDKSAIKAVEFAIKYNAWCGGKIMAYDFVNGREIEV